MVDLGESGECSVRKYTFPDGEKFQACTRSTNLSQELGQARERIWVAEIQNWDRLEILKWYPKMDDFYNYFILDKILIKWMI